MVRIYSLIFLVFLSFNASAAAVALKFNSMPISEVADLFFRSMLKKDYVLSPALLTDNRNITINIAEIPQSKMLDQLTEILKSQGITQTLINTIF